MISSKRISDVFRRAQENGVLTHSENSFIFYDLDVLLARLEAVKKLFPKDTLHAVAIKANPVKKILSFIGTAGMGFEAASLPELHMAINLGTDPGSIVFDSPSKTVEELNFAIDLGIHINADSVMELERIDQILQTKKINGSFGIRINPQVGSGAIETTSVAGVISKFGVPLDENKYELMDCFKRYQWLTGVHVHVGSQGCKVSLITKGIKKVFNFACIVNENQKKLEKSNLISIFDVGGGLPVQYHLDQPAVSMDEYLDRLKTDLPELFDGRYKLITEFGRFFHANSAWAISKIEYIKNFNERKIAMIHLGADMFLRKCYNPNDWHHTITVLDRDGYIKKGLDTKTYDVAGPLCFSGDVIVRDLEMPEVVEGDYIVIHDVGAYTFAMWSRYNSRQMPKILSYTENSFEVIKNSESIDDVLRFWE